MPPITRRPKTVQTIPKVTAKPFLEESEVVLDTGLEVEEGRVDVEEVEDEDDDDENDEDDDNEEDEEEGISPGSRTVYLKKVSLEFTQLKRDRKNTYTKVSKIASVSPGPTDTTNVCCVFARPVSLQTTLDCAVSGPLFANGWV